MKILIRTFIVIGCLCISIIMIYVFAFFAWHFDYRYEFHMFSYIQYNDMKYYIAEEQGQSKMKSISNYYVPVYLVDNSGTVHDEHVYYANVFNDDQEHIFLYFNGGLYTKDINLASSHYNLSIEN